MSNPTTSAPCPPAWHSHKAVCIDGNWYNTSSIKEVIAELHGKAWLVERGFGEFTKAERIMIMILADNVTIGLRRELEAKGLPADSN